jgi:hypothetical protein
MTKKKTASVYSPLWNSDMELPRDRATINAWCRSLYALDPIVSSTIDKHAALIPGYINFCTIGNEQNGEARDRNSFINTMLAKLNITDVISNIITEWFVLGESYIYSELDEKSGTWSRLIVQNPDYIVVKRNMTSDEVTIMMRPDENLRRIVLSKKVTDFEKKQRNQLSASIISAIKNGENIPLDNFYASSFMRKMSPYEIRGTSYLVPLFSIMKKGNKTEQDILTVKEALLDVNFYSIGGQLSLDVLYARYTQIFDMLQQWLNNKIIAPICKLQNLTAVPAVIFDRAKLREDLQMKSHC